MTVQEFDDAVLIDGSQDITQLRVQANASQTAPLQTWEADGDTVLAQVTADGRLELGESTLDTATAQLEVKQDVDLDASDPLVRGLQAIGSVETDSATALGSFDWSVHELVLKGTGRLSSLFSALRARLTHQNTGDGDGAELRAGDFEAINEGGNATQPVSKLVGLRGAVTNEAGAYLTEAVGLDVAVHHEGSALEDAVGIDVVISDENELTNAYGLRIADIPTSVQGDRYAITTGGGVVQIGDHQEWLVQTNTPTANPPADFIKVYPKLDGGDPRLFAKDASGTEHDLSGAGGGASADAQYVTLAADASLTQERVLTAGNGLSLTDGGAGNPVTLDVNVDDTTLNIQSDILQALNGSALWNANQLQGRSIANTAPDDGQVLTWDDGNSLWVPGVGSGQVQSFQAWQRLASAAASISLSSIPQDADHLLILFELDSDYNHNYDGVRIVVNSDTTAANYNSHTAAFTTAYYQYPYYGSQSGIVLGPASLGQLAPANHFSAVWLSILNYSKSGYPHNFHFHGGARTASSAMGQFIGTGVWAGTNPITSLQILPLNGSQFLAGSTYQVWLFGG